MSELRREKLEINEEDEFLFNFTNFIATLRNLTRAEKTILFFILKKLENAPNSNYKYQSNRTAYRKVFGHFKSEKSLSA